MAKTIIDLKFVKNEKDDHEVAILPALTGLKHKTDMFTNYAIGLVWWRWGVCLILIRGKAC